MIKRSHTLVTLVVGLLMISLPMTVLGRRIREQQIEQQVAKVAESLNSGEIVLWVKADGMARVLVKEAYCGELNFDPARFANKEMYKANFFGPLDKMLRDTTGKSISDYDELFVLYEPDVNEETIQQYRTVFRRYKAFYYDCCNKDHGYSCCPNTLDTWFVEAALAAGKIVTDLVHDFEKREFTSIEPIVVFDDSIQEFRFGDEDKESEKPSFFAWLKSLFKKKQSRVAPSLIPWLEGKFPHTTVQSLSLTVWSSGDVQMTPEDPSWVLSPTSLLLVITVYDVPENAPSSFEAVVERAILREIAQRQENPVVVFFTWTDPGSATLNASLSIQPFEAMERGAVFVTATSQPAELLEQTLDALLDLRLGTGSITVDALVETLRPLGLLPYLLHGEGTQSGD